MTKAARRRGKFPFHQEGYADWVCDLNDFILAHPEELGLMPLWPPLGGEYKSVDWELAKNGDIHE